MFFEEHEKAIYKAPNGIQYDPLAIDRQLVVASDNKLNELIAWRNAPYDNLGDVGKESQSKNAVESARAELELARITRLVFGLPDFPEMGDAQVLEVLYDYLDWMKKKGQRDGK